MIAIKPLDPSYEEMARVESEVWPDSYENAESLRHEFVLPDGTFYTHVALFVDEELAGHGYVMAAYWVDAPDRYRVEVCVRPKFQSQGHGKRLWTALLAQIADRAPQYLYVYTREDKLRSLRFLADRGFAQTQRTPVSRLDVQAFDPAPFLSAERRASDVGIRIVTLRQLRERDADWLLHLFEMRWQVLQDIPRTYELKKGTQEAFVKEQIERPEISPDLWFIALGGDRYVGYSFFWISSVDPTKLYTGVTGVVRSHRRKGVATALKLAGFRAARARGVTEIETDNAETNVMYQINLRMGFVPHPAWVTWEKALIAQ